MLEICMLMKIGIIFFLIFKSRKIQNFFIDNLLYLDINKIDKIYLIYSFFKKLILILCKDLSF
jgi:hypothetical protein